MRDNNEPSGKQVVARAAAILKALEHHREGLSLTQLSKATDLPRTTVHRLASALEAQQLLIAGPQGLRLGPALARLAASAHTDVMAIARPFVEALGRRTRETVDLSVLRGGHAILVDQFASDQELRVVSPVGTAFPLHCTAHGKALQAGLDNPEVTLDREEHARGVCGLGVVLATGMQEQYALSLAVPALRFDEQYEMLRTALLKCKAEIEALMGGA